jgi:hypothetical protein
MSRFLNSYVSQVLPALRRQFPGVPEAELKQMVQEEAGAAFSDRSALFHNDATMPHEDLEGSCHPLTFLQWADFVLGKNRPVLTTFGCCYKRHDEARNLVAEMLQHFIDTRKLAKKKMFQHANDADRSERDRWDRVQRVVKILNNSYYGASGERNSWFFNARIGPSVTYTGQTIITTSILAFEQFLAGNAPFGKPGVPGTALSEALMFVERSLAMGSEEGRGFTDVTDLELTHEGVATHLFHRMREVAPGDAEAIGRALSGLTLQELSSVYYRNNLWKFLDGAPVRALVCSIVDSG